MWGNQKHSFLLLFYRHFCGSALAPKRSSLTEKYVTLNCSVEFKNYKKDMKKSLKHKKNCLFAHLFAFFALHFYLHD